MEPSALANVAADTTDPLAGLRAVASLRTVADMLEYRQVETAVGNGHTWTEIAAALGVTRQAVHKKHARRIAPDLRERNPR